MMKSDNNIEHTEVQGSEVTASATLTKLSIF